MSDPAIRITVAETRGSTPREAGAWMLVTAETTTGTIGGGQLEWRAIKAAHEMLAGEETKRRIELPLGPALSQCCGGWVALELERVAGEVAPAVEPGLPYVVLFGAGHVGRATMRALSPLPCRIHWIDERAEVFPGGMPAHVTTSPDPLPAVASAPAGSFFLVMTHSHALDLDLVEAILRREDFAFAGLIGSATKLVRFANQLRARGLAMRQIERLVCPIGIAGISGKAPAVIAASAAAQLLIAFEAMAARAALAEPTRPRSVA